MYFSHINYIEDPIQYVWFDKILSTIMVNIKNKF